MIREFFEQLHGIHPLVGTLGEAAFIGLLLTVAILLLSIPFHLLAFALREPVAAAARFLINLSKIVRIQGEHFFAAALNQPARYVSLARHRFVFDQNERQLRVDLEQIVGATLQIPDAFNGKTSDLEVGVKQLSNRMEALASLEIEASKPQIPDLARLQADGSAYRRGLAKFIIALVLAPALIAINTIMLQKFFDGLISIYVGDFRLSWILSGFFSLLELSLGIILYYQQQKPRTGDARLVLSELILYAVVLGLAVVEFGFYAVLSSQIDSEVFRALFAPQPVPSWLTWWLAPFGPIVVIILAFAGHGLIEGWDELRHGATARALKRQLTAIETAGGKLVSDFEIAKGHAKQLITSVKEFRRLYVGNKDQPPELSEQIVLSVEKLREAAESAKHQRRELYASMDDGEALRSFYVQVALGCIAVIVIGIFLYIQIAFLSRLGPIVAGVPAVVYLIAFVEAGAIVGASFLLSHSARLVIGEADLKVIATSRDWLFGSVAMLTIIAVLAFNVFLIVRETTFNEWLWVALSVACIGAMVYIGRTLSLMLSAVWCAIKAAVLSVTSGMAWFIAGVLAICAVLCLFLNGLMAVLSYPFKILTKPFRRYIRPMEAPA